MPVKHFSVRKSGNGLFHVRKSRHGMVVGRSIGPSWAIPSSIYTNFKTGSGLPSELVHKLERLKVGKKNNLNFIV